MLAEALAVVDETGERFWEAELHRLKGELTLQQANQRAKGKNQKAKIEDSPTSNAQVQSQRRRRVFEGSGSFTETASQIAGTARNDESRAVVAISG